MTFLHMKKNHIIKNAKIIYFDELNVNVSCILKFNLAVNMFLNLPFKHLSKIFIFDIINIY